MVTNLRTLARERNFPSDEVPDEDRAAVDETIRASGLSVDDLYTMASEYLGDDAHLEEDLTPWLLIIDFVKERKRRQLEIRKRLREVVEVSGPKEDATPRRPRRTFDFIDDDADEPLDEETKAITQLLQEQLDLAEARDNRRTDRDAEKFLDADIVDLLNVKPFDSGMSEGFLKKELKRIPFIPNFPFNFPPRWPKNFELLADQAFSFRTKRIDEDWRSFNRQKEAASRAAKSLRVKDDRRKAVTQTLQIQQLRLFAAITQKTRNVVTTLTQLLEKSQLQLNHEEQRRFTQSTKDFEDISRLSKLQLTISKGLLAKATRDRRFTFMRNARGLSHLKDQVLAQSCVCDEGGRWHMLDTTTLNADLQLFANFASNARAALQPFRDRPPYDGDARGRFGSQYGVGYRRGSGMGYNSPSFGRGFGRGGPYGGRAPLATGYNGFGGYSTSQGQSYGPGGDFKGSRGNGRGPQQGHPTDF